MGHHRTAQHVRDSSREPPEFARAHFFKTSSITSAYNTKYASKLQPFLPFFAGNISLKYHINKALLGFFRQIDLMKQIEIDCVSY